MAAVSIMIETDSERPGEKEGQVLFKKCAAWGGTEKKSRGGHSRQLSGIYRIALNGERPEWVEVKIQG